ncbi:hypothetical protein T492DRAFT_906760, partial [Pavlovales sp. CCMP2436]
GAAERASGRQRQAGRSGGQPCEAHADRHRILLREHTRNSTSRRRRCRQRRGERAGGTGARAGCGGLRAAAAEHARRGASRAGQPEWRGVWDRRLRPIRKRVAGPSQASLATRPQAGREVSEEEQLQAALRASLRSKPEQPSVHSAADEDEQVRAAIALSLTHAKLSAGRSKTHGQADSSTAAIIDLSDSQPAEDLAEGDAADGAGKGGGVSEVRAVAQHSGQHSDQHSEQLSVLELREARLRRIHAAGRP